MCRKSVIVFFASKIPKKATSKICQTTKMVKKSEPKIRVLNTIIIYIYACRFMYIYLYKLN